MTSAPDASEAELEERVRRAVARVPREKFVPPALEPAAHEDRPLPIGYGQTISQPSLVAQMTRWLEPQSGDRALDVGTGSGYQAALLAELVGEVYTIEIVPPLAEAARARLEALGYPNIHFRIGDGYEGWPEAAPFQRIVVAAAAPHIPQPLVDQLAPGGRMILPIGGEARQRLWLVQKQLDGSVSERPVLSVMFVPLIRGGVPETDPSGRDKG